MDKILDIYSDYLIAQNQYATAVGLSDLLEGRISHDKIRHGSIEGNKNKTE